MLRVCGAIGLFLVAAGLSGVVDHFVHQPFLGPILNVFNRNVIPHIAALQGYEVFANLFVAAVGGVLMGAAHSGLRIHGSPRDSGGPR